MFQRRRGLVSVLTVAAAMLFVSGATLAVTRARDGDPVKVRSSSARPQAQPIAVPRTPPQPETAAAAQPGFQVQFGPRPVVVPGSVAPPASTPTSTSEATIDVAVATLWLEPAMARPIDEPSLTNPVDIGRWVATMSMADKLWLVGRLATQALHGDRVTVLEESGDWAKVVVADQPSSLDPRGYPGWLPTVQLSRAAAGPATGGPDSRAGSTTGEDLVRSAQSFSGVPYLWAGTSPLGFDCSGLTWSVYRSHGIVIPRDAADQAAAGSPVDRSDLQPGDLLFYGAGPGRDTIHHVAMYVGNATMIQAPVTGRVVETVPVDTPEFAREYWGARRYLAS